MIRLGAGPELVHPFGGNPRGPAGSNPNYTPENKTRGLVLLGSNESERWGTRTHDTLIKRYRSIVLLIAL